ncbi:MAG: TonB-dependent receptor, partial [Pseudomonadota bacterium]
YSYPPASLVALQQERSKGIETGVEYLSANDLRLEAVYFDQDVENAIDFDLVSYSGYLQYVGRSNSRGVELSASMPLTEQLSLQANYTFNDTERPNGQQRLRRPRQLLNAGISWQPQPRLAVHAFARSSRDAVDEPPFAGVVKLDDFVVLDLNASYQLTSTLQLSGRIENALDEQYTEVIGYNTAGAAAYVGVKMNFGSL